jgi:hypothetical protein
MNSIASPEIGHNNPPPDTIASARSAFNVLSQYLKSEPVVETREQAKAAKGQIDLAKSALDALESERDGLVRPLNERVKAVNEEFRAAREPLKRLLDEVKARLDRYLEAEERRRLAELEERRCAAQEAERLAREAEAVEAEAKENAAEGEFTDVGAATAEADARFDEFKRADRAARIAERDANVRIGDGFGRSLSRRTTETLQVDDPVKALRALMKERGGALPEKIGDAIKSAARDYRKAKGELPPGVSSIATRSL